MAASVASLAVTFGVVGLGRTGNAVLVVAAYCLPIVVVEALAFHVYRNPSTGLDFARKRRRSTSRILTKLLGLGFIFGLVALVYWLFPLYRSPFYSPFFDLLRYLAPVVVCGSIPYFIWIDRYLPAGVDAYWHLGRALSGRWRTVDWRMIGQLLLGWLVKVFFLPLMFPSLVGNIESMRAQTLGSANHLSAAFAAYSSGGLFTADLMIAATGYLLTLRVLDSHVRSTEPTLSGWVVTIICYQPFWDFISGSYLNYFGPMGRSWQWTFQNNVVLVGIWGTLIAALLTVYVWASVEFGIRFSNLTNRGVLTRGPYAWMKHPAYITKNLSWWLATVPVLFTAPPGECVRYLLLLVLESTVYFLRARTEERHLSRDPVYRQYALAMNDRGLFAWLGRLVPYLRYDPGRYLRKPVAGAAGKAD